MDPDRSRRHLGAVQHHVVRLREHGPRVGLDQILVDAHRRREHVVLGRPAAGLLVLLEQREVDDVQELPGVAVDQVEALGQLRAQRAEHAR